MRRFPASNDLAQLKQLTEAREQAAFAELSVLLNALKSAEAHVAALVDLTYPTTNPSDAEIVAKWQIWKEQELVRRFSRLAGAKAAYHQASKRCGRVIAEDAVVAHLNRMASRTELDQRAKRQAWITSPDGQCR